MIVNPTITRDIAGSGLALDDFATDKAYPQIAAAAANRAAQPGLIDGVTANALEMNSDERGVLYELLTTRGGLAEPIVHVYQVVAEPGSIRAGSIIADNATAWPTRRENSRSFFTICGAAAPP